MKNANLSGTVWNENEESKCESLIRELLASRFFTVSCDYSKRQRNLHEDRKVLIRSMMLLDAYNVPDFEPPDFSEESIGQYWENFQDSYSDKQSNIMKSAIQYLTDAFPETNKQLGKAFIPLLVCVADIAEDNEIKPISFGRWFMYFVQKVQSGDKHQMFGSEKRLRSKKKTQYNNESNILNTRICYPKTKVKM